MKALKRSKRIISLALVAAMILSFGIVAQAANYPDKITLKTDDGKMMTFTIPDDLNDPVLAALYLKWMNAATETENGAIYITDNNATTIEYTSDGGGFLDQLETKTPEPEETLQGALTVVRTIDSEGNVVIATDPTTGNPIITDGTDFFVSKEGDEGGIELETTEPPPVIVEPGGAGDAALAAAWAAVEALSADEYTTESWEAFEAALELVEEMPENTDAQKGAKAAAIYSAISKLEKPDVPDYLAEAKADKKAEIDALISGLNETLYTTDSWSAVIDAIADAKAAIDLLETVEEVEAYDYSAVETAIGNLEIAASEDAVTVALDAATDALAALDIEAIADDADALAEMKSTLEGLYSDLDTAFETLKDSEGYEADAELEAEVGAALAGLTAAIEDIDEALDMIDALTDVSVDATSATNVTVTMRYGTLPKSAFALTLTDEPHTALTINTANYSTATETDEGYYTLSIATPGLLPNVAYTLTITNNDVEVYKNEEVVFVQTSTISGTVGARQADSDSTTVTPLEGAAVIITNTDGEVVDETVTGTGDDAGNYESADLPSTQTYNITVTAEGYKTYESAAPVNVGAQAPITLLSQAVKLYSINSAIAVIDVDDLLVKVPENSTASGVAAVLTVQHGGKFAIYQDGAPVTMLALPLRQGDEVRVTAEDGTTTETYTVAPMTDEDYLETRIGALTLAPGTAGKVSIVGTTTDMKYQIVAVNSSATTGGTEFTATAPNTEVTANVGQKIVVYTGTFYSNGVHKELVVGFEHVGPATAPSVTVTDIMQGATPYSAKFTVTNASTDWEYQIAPSGGANLSGTWTPFTSSGMVTIEVTTAGTGDNYLYVREKQTADYPASAATSGVELKIHPGTLSFTAAKASATTGTTITGIPAGTAPNNYTYRYFIFSSSQITAKPDMYTNVSALPSYTAILNNGNIATTSGDIGKYLVIAKFNAANLLVEWNQVQITHSIVSQVLPTLSGVTAAALDSVSATTDGGLSKLTHSVTGGNILWISNAKMPAIPTLEVGQQFAALSSSYTVAGASGSSFKFQQGAGTYAAVETTASGEVVKAGPVTVAAEHITYIIKVTDSRTSPAGLSYNTDTTNGDTVSKTGVVALIKLAGAYSATAFKFGNHNTYASSTAHLSIPAPSPVDFVYNVSITDESVWDYSFDLVGNNGTFTKVASNPTTGTTQFMVNTDGTITIGSTKYNMPKNETLRSVINGLKAGDSFETDTTATSKLKAITIAGGATPAGLRTVTIAKADCYTTLTLTGGTVAGNALVLTTKVSAGFVPGDNIVKVAAGHVHFEDANFGGIAVTASTGVEVNIKAVNTSVITVPSAATNVTINGIKATSNASSEFTVIAGGLSVPGAATNFTINASALSSDVTFKFTSATAQSGEVVLTGPNNSTFYLETETGGITASTFTFTATGTGTIDYSGADLKSAVATVTNKTSKVTTFYNAHSGALSAANLIDTAVDYHILKAIPEGGALAFTDTGVTGTLTITSKDGVTNLSGISIKRDMVVIDGLTFNITNEAGLVTLDGGQGAGKKGAIVVKFDFGGSTGDNGSDDSEANSVTITNCDITVNTSVTVSGSRSRAFGIALYGPGTTARTIVITDNDVNVTNSETTARSYAFYTYGPGAGDELTITGNTFIAERAMFIDWFVDPDLSDTDISYNEFMVNDATPSNGNANNEHDAKGAVWLSISNADRLKEAIGGEHFGTAGTTAFSGRALGANSLDFLVLEILKQFSANTAASISLTDILGLGVLVSEYNEDLAERYTVTGSVTAGDFVKSNVVTEYSNNVDTTWDTKS